MRDQDRQVLIQYRLDQAGDALEQGVLLHANGYSNGAINRAYKFVNNIRARIDVL